MTGGHGSEAGNLPEWFDPKLQQFTRSWRQAMPPKGGYPAIRHRYLSPSKGLAMRLCWALFIGNTVYWAYGRKQEKEHEIDLLDVFHAQSQAVIPYFMAEYQLKNLIQDHYEKKYREFVAPEMVVDDKKFFTHPIPGALGAFRWYIKGKEVHALRRIMGLNPHYAFDPVLRHRRDLENKFDRMLGFAIDQ